MGYDAREWDRLPGWMQVVYQTGIVRELVSEAHTNLSHAAASAKRVDVDAMKRDTPPLPPWWGDQSEDDVDALDQATDEPQEVDGEHPAAIAAGVARFDPGLDAALFGVNGPSGSGFTVKRVTVVDDDGVTETEG